MKYDFIYTKHVDNILRFCYNDFVRQEDKIMFNVYDIFDKSLESDLYSVKLNGEKAGCYSCTCSAVPFNRIWPGYQRSEDQTEEAAFLYFDADEPVYFEVKTGLDTSDTVIRPLSKNIKADVEGDTIRFVINNPGQYTLECSGYHHALHIFYNPVKDFGIKPDNNGGVIYFAPGVHDIEGGVLRVKSDSIIYFAPGSVVYGGLLFEDVENVLVMGYGILDNSRNERGHGTTVRAVRSKNIVFDGVIFKDSCEWTASCFACENLIFSNVKALGMWRYNSDGIDFCNCRGCVIEDSFLRNYDDVVVLKGIKSFDSKNTENIVVSNCVLWCDWGRNLEIGAETCADEIRNVVFENCDLIHCAHVNMDIQNGDRAYVHDIIYENLNIEYSRYNLMPVYQNSDDMIYEPKEGFEAQLFTAYSTHTFYSHDKEFGRISGILVKDINVTLDEGMPVPPSIIHGFGENNLTENIMFDNIVINGRKITSLEEMGAQIGAFTKDISVK